MPRRDDLETILVIGAGPIVIGQACEFDYSGTQACGALKEEGYRVVLLNSNPATIMTDPAFSDATYIEPICEEAAERIIEKERPCALLPTVGGQTALNVSMRLAKKGVLDCHGVEMIGASALCIERAEDRQVFKSIMEDIGFDTPKAVMASSEEEAMEGLRTIGLPVVIRPSFTLGGQGGGIARKEEEFLEIIRGGLKASLVHQVMIEQSVLNWKEYEMEVVRDKNDNCIIVCSIENIDPVGVHTGDSVTVAPALTLTDKEYQAMRNASFRILRAIGIETGGSNVQFAVEPESGRMVVIEMNPRVSRSSALASKATGFPIAKIASKLAIGYTLDELKNDITRTTPASFEPTLDYVVTKMPRFAFEKFPAAVPRLGTSMHSVGEAMAIGGTFKESLQKLVCSLETGLDSLSYPGEVGTKEEVLETLGTLVPHRLLLVAEAFRLGATVEQIYGRCFYDRWFLRQIKELVEAEEILRAMPLLPTCRRQWFAIKEQGFSDAFLARLWRTDEQTVFQCRKSYLVTPRYCQIDTTAAEFESYTPYLYSTYVSLAPFASLEAVPSSGSKRVLILGSGPNRIGQGLEFDYCCVHGAWALKAEGVVPIMVNCNPETVSTDYDTADRLYFEPITLESLRNILHFENTVDGFFGVISQFGGQTPLNLVKDLEKETVILGTSAKGVELAEDRKHFSALVAQQGLSQPRNGAAFSFKQALCIAKSIGFPVMVRPSYILGGQKMCVIHSEEALKTYIESNDSDDPILIEEFLEEAIEVDVDCLYDGKTIYLGGIMEHIERVGIHSGDSACVLPSQSLSRGVKSAIFDHTRQLADSLGVRGLMNVQYAIKGQQIYVIEANPRASRTIPFVSKATGTPLMVWATKILMGHSLESIAPELSHEQQRVLSLPYVCVKESVFPFKRFKNVDILLGPEMRSTGEVMGIDRDVAKAFAKAQMAAGGSLPMEGLVLISVKDDDKSRAFAVARTLKEAGFSIVCTKGTATFCRRRGLKVQMVQKVVEGSPHIVERIQRGEIKLVFNTTEGKHSIEDSFKIRRITLLYDVPYFTTIEGMEAMMQAILSVKKQKLDFSPLQDYSL